MCNIMTTVDNTVFYNLNLPRQQKLSINKKVCREYIYVCIYSYICIYKENIYVHKEKREGAPNQQVIIWSLINKLFI